ncbi:MAG: HdeA/HdeB family chaperone [Devosia sp.]|nr:HdeA/HdeB family chaperone [Devosia sp.]
MKNRAVVLAALVALGFGVTSASAETMDFSKMTCRELLKLADDDKGIIIVWLEGYFNKRNGPAVLDTDKMTADGSAFGKYCGRNPGATVLDAASAAGVARH